MKKAYEVNWSDDNEIVSFVEGFTNDRLDDLQSFFRECYVNILWSAIGRQDIFYDRYSRSLVDTRPPAWKVKIISNLLFPQLRRTIAKLAKQPIWDVLPATTEQEDINVANISKNILTHYWFYLKMPSKFITYLTWLVTTGNAFMKIGWDAQAGETLELNPEERAILQNVSGKRPPKKIQLGDPFIEVVSLFSLIWDKGLPLDEAENTVHIKLRTPEYIYRRYKKKVNPSKSSRINYDFKLFDIHKGTEFGSDDTCKVIILEYMSKEKMAVICDGEVLVKGDNPYGELPYVHTKEVPLPGNEYGTSSVAQNRPNQAQYNAIRSRIIQHSVLMGNPKRLVPRGARVKEGVFTDQSGEIIEYNHPFKPENETPPALPAYIERILQTCKEDMRDVGSFHEVSQAQGEPGLRSGKAVLALQDADDLIQTVPLQMIDESLRAVGAKLLRILHKFVTEERLIRITGSNRELQVYSFTGESLQGKSVNQPGANYFDVRVATFSAYPLTRVGMEERMAFMIELGLLDPQRDRKKILSILSNSDLGAELDESQPDATQAAEENYSMIKGQPVPAFSIEDHETHIDIHKSFLKPKLRQLSQSKEGQQIIELFMKHIDDHEMKRAQDEARKNMYMMQAQMPMLAGAGLNPQAVAGAMK
jgi:hypothetical protein